MRSHTILSGSAAATSVTKSQLPFSQTEFTMSTADA